MPEETIFDQILARQIHAKIVFEDEWVLAFEDINPQAPIHILVIPKKKMKHLTEFTTQSSEVIGMYMQRIAQIAQQLNLEQDGFRVVFNQGKNGQQTVAYLHAHILGGRQMAWPPG